MADNCITCKRPVTLRQQGIQCDVCYSGTTEPVTVVSYLSYFIFTQLVKPPLIFEVMSDIFRSVEANFFLFIEFLNKIIKLLYTQLPG